MPDETDAAVFSQPNHPDRPPGPPPPPETELTWRMGGPMRVLHPVRPPRPTAPRKTSLAVGIALVAGLLVGGGGWAMVSAGEGCSGKRPSLSVTADSAIAPAVTAAAERFNTAECAAVSVVAAESAETAGALMDANAANGRAQPDAWIPDSALWVDLVRGKPRGKALLGKDQQSLASSPLVFVVSSKAPATVRSDLRQRSWGALRPEAGQPAARFRLRLPDPAQTATGMAALLMVQQISATGGGQPVEAFSGIMQSAGTTPISGSQQLAAAYGSLTDENGPTPLLVDSEQGYWRQARAGGPLHGQVTAVYPVTGTASLDFPFVTSSTDAAKRRLAGRFRAALRARATTTDLYKIGLRTPDGRGQGTAPQAAIIPVAQPGAAAAIQGAWSRMHVGTRALTLLDVSGSMLEPMPGTKTNRIKAVTRALAEGVTLMPDDAEFGLWSFSTNMDGKIPYRRLVPLGPLAETVDTRPRRAALQAALAGLRAKPDGDTGLYDSILAGYRRVEQGYAPDKLNIVLVLTDGRNDNPGGITLTRLLSELKRSFNPSRPVSVIAIGFGGDIDLASMQKIAKATDGGAYRIDDPRQIMELFQRSVSLRICDDPKCPR